LEFEMIDLLHEDPITLNKAREFKGICRNGRKPDLSTIYRWAEAGVRGVKLETIVVAGSTCTTIPALLRFLAAMNGRAVTASPTARQRRQQALQEEADAYLDEARA
jgi:hypothetical protein